MIFASALTLMAFVTKAQTQKSDWMIGGSANFDAAKNTTTFGINPSAGYFFADNFVGGANIGYQFSKYGDSKASVFSAGPFVRYYAGNMESPFRPFLHANINFGTQKTDGSSSVGNTTFYVAPGAAYFLNKNVALEATAGYQNVKIENQSSSGGFALRIGFQIHLTGSQVAELKSRKK